MLVPPEDFPDLLMSAWGQDEQGLWSDVPILGVVQRFRWISAGEFLMGSPEDEAERQSRERQHEVELTRGFWLADTACTQALWQEVMGENPSHFQGKDRPVENVSWEDCDGFIEKLNGEVPGLGACLPTEAQWEYACRAGTKTPFSFGENLTPEQVNYDGNYPYSGGTKGKYREETVAVKSLSPNDWGLYEMHGNVDEWCADWFGDYPDGLVIDPVGPIEGGRRVLRGGSWISLGRYCRSACRLWNPPGDRSVYIGFRLSRGQASPGTTPEAAS
jgi:formylglycine-generating enzyme